MTAGVSRNLTSVYVKFRNEHKQKKNRFGTGLLDTGHQRLLTEEQEGRRTFEVEMTSLPPQWIDTVDQANANLTKIKERIEQLRKAHQKRLRQVFKDDQDDSNETEIANLSISIGALFRECESSIHEIQTRDADMGLTNKEYTLRQNVQRRIATELQQLSQQFRKIQKSYLDDLQKREKSAWGDDGAAGLTAANNFVGENQALETEVGFDVEKRSEEIARIAQSISDLHTIFKELAVLVIDQGTVLDRIDYNVEQVVHQTREATVQLRKANEKAKSNRAMKCILFLIGGICVEVLLLAVKWSH